MGVGLQAPQAELRFDEQAGVTLIAWLGALTHCMDDCLDESTEVKVDTARCWCNTMMISTACGADCFVPVCVHPPVDVSGSGLGFHHESLYHAVSRTRKLHLQCAGCQLHFCEVQSAISHAHLSVTCCARNQQEIRRRS